MTTALTKRQEKLQSINTLLERGKGKIEKAIPKTLAHYLTPERLIRIAVNASAKNPELLECEPTSIANSVMESAQLGLECDGVLGHGYLVPRFSKKMQCKVAEFWLGYKGMMDLAYRANDVARIDAEAVYEGDEFRYSKGLNPVLEHVSTHECDETEENLTHAWALIEFTSGAVAFKVLTKRQIERLRSRSSQPNGTTWRKDYGAMACAKALRQLLKYVPQSPEAKRQVTAEETRETTGEPATDDISGEFIVPEREPGQEEMKPEPKPETEPETEPETKTEKVEEKLNSRRRPQQQEDF